VAFFGKKKSDDSSEQGGEDVTVPSVFSPKKAAAFFDRADTVHDSGNYEFAMQMWLSGLRFDPTNIDAMKKFLRSSEVFAVENPKKGVSKETKNLIQTKGDVGKFISALLEFGLKPIDTSNAIRVTETAGKLGLKEQTQMLGDHALKLAQNDKKPKKDMFVKLLDAFEAVEAYKLAAVAGENAMQMDRGDAQLANRVRNMLARSTMSSGGYDNDEEGGFKKNIRDADKQMELSQSDSASKTESTKDQIVSRTAEEYKQRPEDIATLVKYAKALEERGKSSDELKAMMLYSKAFKATSQPRYRMLAGEIQLRKSRRQLEKYTEAAAGSPDDVAVAEKLDAARKSYKKLQLSELQFQVENYPTDLALKYKLGKIYYEDGLYKEAIEQFQIAQNDAKLKRNVLNLMAMSFVKLGGWEDAAIQTFEQAMGDRADDSSELGMELRYGLMDALQIKATKDRDMVSAERADKLAAGIAIQNFSYRDVSERREQIKQLITELKG